MLFDGSTVTGCIALGESRLEAGQATQTPCRPTTHSALPFHPCIRTDSAAS